MIVVAVVVMTGDAGDGCWWGLVVVMAMIVMTQDYVVVITVDADDDRL